MEHTPSGAGLPLNAYTELKPGEKYVPIVPAESTVKELTFRSIFMGILMAILFSGAAAFLGLKIAQVFEAAIPIAILAVGFGLVAKRKSTLLENVIIQSIGASSGLVVAGAIFTLPALYVMGLDKITSFAQLFIPAVLGAILGVFFLIPLRRYFVADMHGKLPFPEATATTEVLVAGEKGGAGAKVLAIAAVIGGVYDFLCLSMTAWRETFSTDMIELFKPLTDKAKAIFSINTGAAVLGLGYIIGLRYAAIICAGSFLSWFVFVPLFAHFGGMIPTTFSPAPEGSLIANMGADEIFKYYVRSIGIGGIFVAGLLGIIKSFGVIAQAFTKGFKEIFASRKAHVAEGAVERTNKDIPMSIVIIGIVLMAVLIWAFFRYSVMASQPNALMISLISLVIAMVISFLFTTVGARAIAIVGVNPVSGMTLTTLIIACLVLVAAGLTGESGMAGALLVGTVVCTAITLSGGLVTDLKIGYWLGSTPSRQQWCKIFGSIVSAVTVCLVIMLLAKVYGFSPSPEHPKPLPAPQANAMAAVIKGIMASGDVPWMLYGLGGVIALIMNMVGVAPLAFALGMYIPLSLNTPLLLGAVVAHFVAKSSKNEDVSKERREKGTLIASGFIAGGALMGVVGAVIKWIESETGKVILPQFANEGYWGNWLGATALALLCLYLYLSAKKAAK